MHADTVTATGTYRTMAPPEAAMVTVCAPDGGETPAVSVSVLPGEPAVSVAAEKLAVSPDGKPLATSVTGALKPVLTVSCRATEACAPATSETAAGDAVK